MDSLNKHVQQISFRQYVTFCVHLQLKGWQPHFQPTVEKKLNLNNCSLVCSSHIAQLRARSLRCNKSWRPQLRDKTLCFSACDRSFSYSCNEGMGMMQPQRRADEVSCGPQEPQASGMEWLSGIPKRNGGNGFLKQTCPTNLFSAVRHILQMWPAERLAAPLPNRGG